MGLQELLDREEITRLVYRLSAVLDEGRFEEMPSIFTADAAVRTPGGTAEGREALIAQAKRTHSPDLEIQHLVSNVLVDLDDDRADVRANLIAAFAPAGDPGEGRSAPEVKYTLGEVYRIKATRTPDGWRLTRLESNPVWSSGTRP